MKQKFSKWVLQGSLALAISFLMGGGGFTGSSGGTSEVLKGMGEIRLSGLKLPVSGYGHSPRVSRKFRKVSAKSNSTQEEVKQ